MQLFIALIATCVSLVFTSNTPVCTDEFRLVSGKCLRLFTSEVIHSVAERTCMNYGATLVTIKNAVDNRGIQTVAKNFNNTVWMGLYCFGDDVTKCLWDDASGDSSLYSSFMAGNPQVQTGKCVYYSNVNESSTLGKWYSSDCENTARPFICELPSTYEDDCGNNYNGFCYTHNPAATFTVAQATCEASCGNLVSIHSANENRYLNSLFLQSGSGIFYIGAIRTSRNSYSWFDGSLWSYNNFDVTALRPAGVQCPANPPPVIVTPVPSNPSYCNSALLMAPGTITSPNFLNNYDNYLNCTYQLATLGSYNILLKFTSFYTEGCCDIVRVYDDDNVNSPLLGTYSGSLGSFSVVSTGNSMLITFKTDGSITFYGFSASFSSYVFHT
ncbi:hypothetical protein CAEBREN_23248 [Caenorhabditis brenneri]|uniref:C-type LECtin n=1 Tax=Caenorhabditis brenneri TaxID=135651 RepID=G0MCU7_CAEBE|nr:hypothetical protein CAEBREN_23248 [Caenorhabditis brenneri]